MPEFKVVVSDPKTGKAKQIEVKGPQAQAFIGLKIGDVIDGDVIGLKGVKLKITGGSDRSGFPMHPGITGGGKRRILLSGPPGFHPRRKGERRRKTVRGNVITEDIVQINTVIVYEESQK
ncbi:MAG: 30S ribosomal protein S6e [Thermoprotei archaeon]|nr:MAG: 30S ribosomal protein S6e [Thermoprotei archaeon]RLF24978.1 MAG: 30S ribosomal protein S6e [Thermoprotei archaeon]